MGPRNVAVTCAGPGGQARCAARLARRSYFLQPRANGRSRFSSTQRARCPGPPRTLGATVRAGGAIAYGGGASALVDPAPPCRRNPPDGAVHIARPLSRPVRPGGETGAV